eukprot:6578449-Alexandrium_andersonii.AAC.1
MVLQTLAAVCCAASPGGLPPERERKTLLRACLKRAEGRCMRCWPSACLHPVPREAGRVGR